MNIKRNKDNRHAGFMMTEAIASLALLGLLMVMIAKFEYRAAAAARSLEEEYTATVAAESQFERLKAGLDVLDRESFQEKYPGLSLDYQVQEKNKIGVVTITTEVPEPRVLIKLTGPIPPGEKK